MGLLKQSKPMAPKSEAVADRGGAGLEPHGPPQVDHGCDWRAAGGDCGGSEPELER